ncbi:MAG: DUF6714 family protein [Elusimicrobiota bacterium]
MKEALAAVSAAFKDVPPPARDRIVLESPEDPEPAARTAEIFAPLERGTLDAAFLEEHWSCFCYFSPEAYRYFLPALLERALEAAAADPESSLPHPTVCSLAPDYYRLYTEGGDARFEERRSLFSPAQEEAVAASLGAMMGLPDLEYVSAQVLRWGWSRRQTPAAALSRVFYERMRGHAYPEPDASVSGIVSKVRSSFESTGYPGDEDLCGSDQGDEAAEYALEFKGTDWRTLHPAFLSRNSAALSFLTPGAFRYFLPAFLIADLYGESGSADPVFHLTHALMDPNDDLHVWTRERLSAIQGSERAAVVAYLEWTAGRDDQTRQSIEPALNGFWKS